MADRVLFVVAVQNLQHPEVDPAACTSAVCRMIRMRWPARLGLPTGLTCQPLSVHLQMRVDASRSHPDEQVLAPTDDLVDHLALRSTVA